MFADRRDAGQRLATKLVHYRGTDCIVLGVPRGGVVVADEVAAGLGAPLEALVVRKIRAPADAELGIGAVAAGAVPEVALDDRAIAILGVLPDYVCDEVARQLAEARLCEALLREGRRPAPLADRTVILVDDGIATGNTMSAAVHVVGRAGPRRLVVATPVAAFDGLVQLRPSVDEIVCLRAPRQFDAVGAFYRDFPPVSDGEVIALLARARARVPFYPAPIAGRGKGHAGETS